MDDGFDLPQVAAFLLPQTSALLIPRSFTTTVAVDEHPCAGFEHRESPPPKDFRFA
jgi:hypothetical protein